jgi:23S rRNA (guanosine2251-2'-O)-methyltransferase
MKERETLFGRQPVLECLRAGRREILRLMVAANVRTAAAAVAQILKAAERRGLAVSPMGIPDLDRLCRGGHHQGVAAEVSPYPYADLDALTDAAGPGGAPALLLLLDHVQDPQNLGAILRTADAAGVHGVVIPRDRASEVTPAVVRASAGAAEHVSIACVVNLHQTMLRLKEQGVWLVGLEAEPAAKLYHAADLTGPLCLVVGGEGEGLGRLVRDTCDFLVRLPMQGKVASLNASVAAGIALYEVLRQRAEGRPGKP